MENTKTKICPLCGKLIWQLSTFCKSCAHKGVNHQGKNHPNFKDGRTLKKYYCKYCGKELSSYQAKMCRSCAGKRQKRISNGRNYPNCIDCGKKLSHYKSIRCQSCACKESWRIFKNKPVSITKKIIKKYYCIEPNCNNEICYKTFINGTKTCASCAKKKTWQNKEYRDNTIKRMFKAFNKTPNKKEIIVDNILNRLFPKEYKFVGNGQIFIAGFVPDFININGQKKLIEFYGDYWHNREDAIKRDKKRIKTYKKYGYKTLIIWEHELINLNKLESRIKDFQNAY